MAEETIRYNVEYEVTGIDSSVRNTQRLLYAMNAVRLSVRDVQEVMAGPTLQNVMWTAIQLTRVWTALWRLVQAVNKEQKAALAGGVVNQVAAGVTGNAVGAGVVGGATGGAMAGGLLFPTLWFLATNPIAVVGITAAAATIGIVAWDINNKRQYQDWLQRQREAAKNQGFEY